MPLRTQIIGVHSLSFNEAMVAEQAEILYGEDAAGLTAVRELFESTVLIEVLVEKAGDDFNVGAFTQEDASQPRDNWQSAWAEVFLTPDGSALIAERWAPLPPGCDRFRVAFFMHRWVVGLPLMTANGPLPTPLPTTMPERLIRLAPYEYVD
ncbi:MAG TPA: hypothetical protein PK400_12930 [Phycisphaerales bacterium]|nr:hypothetical protein [Phycisphaerales bacterium]HRQ76400.1 hypothetical protein [Phycisphaerales bacterium]